MRTGNIQMNHHRTFSSSLIAMAALLALSACNTTPDQNAQLEQARSAYRLVQDNPQSSKLAGGEMRQASQAIDNASEAWTRRDSSDVVDHLSYLAIQRVAIASEAVKQKSDEMAVLDGEAARDKVRLTARTIEADAAHRQSDAAKQDTAVARARSAQLEAQLRALSAKKTDRGMVITMGDVLFDTDRAQLKSGGVRNLEKLSEFLKQYPQRHAMIEGFTDNTGSDSHNQDLSSRRADTVRATLVEMGVGMERLTTHGYGESYPVAGNDNRGGRQMNRRVEVVLSDDSGVVVPR
jgi:outer membrane protein OmpA-like peptidoglycan-associated protein